MGIGDEIRDEIADGIDQAFSMCRAMNTRCSCAERGVMPCDSIHTAMMNGGGIREELERIEAARGKAGAETEFSSPAKRFQPLVVIQRKSDGMFAMGPPGTSAPRWTTDLASANIFSPNKVKGKICAVWGLNFDDFESVPVVPTLTSQVLQEAP